MTRRKKINRDMPVKFKYFFDDGILTNNRPSDAEMRFWLHVVCVEDPEIQNWQTMVTVRDGEDVFVCQN